MGADVVHQRPKRAALALVAALALAVLVIALSDMRALALGWLVAWLFCLSIAVGASVWLLIGSLTGGRWLACAAPVLKPLATATWLVALGGVLLVLVGPMLYPWWAETAAAQPISWLNPALFGLRAALVLALWSGIGLLAARGVPPLAAATVLILHGLAVSVAGVGWVLSLDPAFVSTSFGAHLAVLQLALAISVVAVAPCEQQVGDIGGLMLACVLGVFYLGAMTYLVSWAGNLPHKAAWYLARQEGGALVLLWLSFLVGILGPFAVLLLSRARRSLRALRWTGAAMLVGGLLHLAWMVAPDRAVSATLIAVALVAVILAAAALLRERAT